MPTLTANLPTLSTSNFAHLQGGLVGGDVMQDFSDPPYIIYKKEKEKVPLGGSPTLLHKKFKYAK